MMQPFCGGEREYWPWVTPGREDCVAWNYNRSGLFSVKSAYHCQWKKKFRPRLLQPRNGDSSSSQLWKKLWNLKVPSKIKIVLLDWT